MRYIEPVSGLMDSILFTVPYVLSNQNIACERAYDDEIGQNLSKTKTVCVVVLCRREMQKSVIT